MIKEKFIANKIIKNLAGNHAYVFTDKGLYFWENMLQKNHQELLLLNINKMKILMKI